MNKFIAGIIFIACIGIAAAYWARSSDEDMASVASIPVTTGSFDESAPINARIATLEQAVNVERQARQLLQEEVMVLADELERLASNEITEEIPAEALRVTEEQEIERDRFRRRRASTGRTDRLVASGFTAGEADWIVQRESELRMEGLQARYDAEKEGKATDFDESRRSASDALRQELGDADYERYLEANGSSTGITVSTVLESSPALAAGLQIGDEIINYDGKRVFNMTDLARQTLQGESGQNIVVDIQRDGIPMQLVLPRGPVGISGGRRFGR